MRFARAKTDIKLERVGVVIVKDLATKPRPHQTQVRWSEPPKYLSDSLWRTASYKLHPKTIGSTSFRGPAADGVDRDVTNPIPGAVDRDG